MVYSIEWINQHERVVYECEENKCFYSIDVFCEGELGFLNKNFELMIPLTNDWYIGILSYALEPDLNIEAEYLVNQQNDSWQLINIKISSNKNVSIEEINIIKKKLCGKE